MYDNDGEVLCGACKTGLNRTDRNCFKCGSTNLIAIAEDIKNSRQLPRDAVDLRKQVARSVDKRFQDAVNKAWDLGGIPDEVETNDPAAKPYTPLPPGNLQPSKKYLHSQQLPFTGIVLGVHNDAHRHTPADLMLEREVISYIAWCVANNNSRVCDQVYGRAKEIGGIIA